MTTEMVTVEYVEMKAENYADGVDVSDATLEQRYETERARFGTAERRLASHILFAVPADATPEQQKAASDKAQAALKRIRGGEKFAAVAKALSDDPGSKEQGGDLGFIEQNGTMEKPFEDALFALNATGDLSEPVSTRFGYHLIELRDIEASRQKTFAEVKDQLREELIKEQTESKFLTESSKVVDETISDSSSLDGVVEQFKLPLQTAGPFGRIGGEGVAANPAFVEAAFSDDVLKSGYNSPSVMLTPTHLVVLRLKEHQPSKRQPLDAVRAQVVDRVVAEKATAALRDQAKALAARAAKGETLDQLVAAAAPATIVDAGEIGRSGSSVDPALVGEVFKLAPPPAGQKTLVDVPFSESRRFALVELSQVTDGDPKKLTDAERDQLRQQLVQGATSAELATLVSALRKRAEITVKDDLL
jgi:peptidyl-prolyl cis-trans isomerase D